MPINLSNLLDNTYVGFTGSSGAFASVGFTGSIGFTGSNGFTGSQGPSNIPINSQTSSYNLQASDTGKFVSITTGGVTVPTAIFSVGDVITIYNDSASSQTITQGASTTLYLAGTSSTGNRTISQRGLCTIICVASNTFAISGAGVS